MGYIQGILSALSLLKSLVDGAKALFGMIEANKNEAWFQESSKVFTKLREAKTDEDRKKVGRELADLWRGVGR